MISSFGRRSMSAALTVPLPLAWMPRMRGATSARSRSLSGACVRLWTVNSRWSRSNDGPCMPETERMSTFIASGLEFGRELIRAAGEQPHVGADRDEQRAEIEVAPRELLVRRQDPGRLAARADAADRVVDLRQNRGVRRLARVAEGGVEIGRSDEDPVDAVEPRDRLDLVDRRLGLELDQHAELLVRALRVVLDPAEPGRPRRAAHSAHACRRVARIGDGLARLVDRLDERDQQGLRADVEHALDRDHVVPGHAHDRMHGVRRDRLQLAEHHVELVRRVLGVDEEPVEARAGARFGAVVVREREPETDLQLTNNDGAFKQVGWQIHKLLRMRKKARILLTLTPLTGPSRLGARNGQPLACELRPTG